MPIETVLSDLKPRRGGDGVTVDPIVAEGHIAFTTGTVENAVDATSGSSYFLTDLPSDCLLHPMTFFVVDTWGFGSVRVGTKDVVDALLSTTRSAAAVAKPVAEGDANSHLRLWQILGLAEDPGGMIGIWAHGIATATVAGSMKFQIATIRN